MDILKSLSFVVLIVVLLLSVVNYSDNRKQDHLLFGTIDNITGLIESDTLQTEINLSMTEALFEITNLLQTLTK